MTQMFDDDGLMNIGIGRNAQRHRLGRCIVISRNMVQQLIEINHWAVEVRNHFAQIDAVLVNREVGYGIYGSLVNRIERPLEDIAATTTSEDI